MRNETHFYEIADTAKLLVVYPQGMEVTARNIPMTGTGWNSPDNYTASQNDVAFVVNIIEQLQTNSDLNIDLSRIYAIGVSGGGHFVNYLACVLSDRIAAVAAIAAVMSDTLSIHPCTPSRQISALYMLGTKDPYFPMEGDATWLPFHGTGAYYGSLNNCDAIPDSTDLPDIDLMDSTTVTLFSYMNCDNNQQVYAYRINGGQHNWPGGWYPPDWPVWGKNNDINAGAEAWKFFSKHVHPNPVVSTPRGIADYKILIYPNPASSKLVIEFGKEQIGAMNIKLLDISGKILCTHTTEKGKTTHTLNLSDFDEGIYLITISNSEYTVTEKVIKVK